MVNVEARLKVKGKEYQILVDADKALDFKKGQGIIEEVLAIDEIFSDYKKGLKVSREELENAFGTSDVKEIASKIVKEGEIVLPTEYRNKERENKLKQMIDFLSKNSIDSTTGTPISEMRIKEAIEQAGINIDNKPIEQQVGKVVEKLRQIIPIKLETKKLKIIVPAVHTGKVYGLLKEYSEKEEWLNNGDLQVILNIPSGIQMEFYDKLNAITHGSCIVEEIKEE